MAKLISELITNREKTCCFSGYRPHKFPFKFNETEEGFKEMESGVLNAILQCCNEGFDTFLCGGAMGFDLLCGELTLLAKGRFPNIKLICVLPFVDQAEKFPRQWRQRYDNVINNCDEVYYVEEEYIPGCYFDRNEKMVDSAVRVITYHNGRSGGTARTIAYAQLNKLEILNLCKDNPLPEQLTFFTAGWKK